MNKDIIKYALLALGAYLVYKYAQEHGGFSSLLGGTTSAHTGTTTTTITQPGTTYTPPVTTYTPPVPVIDLTGLTVFPDINGSLTGYVKINGVPTRLAIIQADGRIFDASGQEVTASLAARGIDINALRAAFASAPQTAALSGLGAWGPRPHWLN